MFFTFRNKQRNGPDRSGGPGGSGGGSGGLMDGSGGGISSMARTSHPPLSGGPLSVGTATPALASSLPTAKPASSSYQTGTKFHSSHAANSTTGEAQYNSIHAKGSQESDAQTLEISAVQFPRHRIHRRTKDQEAPSKANSNPQPLNRDSASASNTQHNRGVQFDLEASAFPPLPGLDADHIKSHNPLTETTAAESLQSQNRLSDVVKGTAKLKSTKEKEPGIAHQYNQQHQHQTSNSSRSASPGSHIVASYGSSQENAAGPSISFAAPATAASSNSNPSASNIDVPDINLSTITLTPPSSPDK